MMKQVRHQGAKGLAMFIDIDFVVAAFDNSMERKIEPAAKGSVLLDGSW